MVGDAANECPTKGAVKLLLLRGERRARTERAEIQANALTPLFHLFQYPPRTARGLFLSRIVPTACVNGEVAGTGCEQLEAIGHPLLRMIETTFGTALADLWRQ